MTIKAVEKLANELLDTTFTIKTSQNTYNLNAKKIGYSFKFDRAKRRFGCCKYTKKLITLSKHMCEQNLHQLNGKIRDTILHELAHAFSYHIYGMNGTGHGWRWKNVAKQIGSVAKRCYSYDDFGGLNKPESKYTLSCSNCGHTSPMHRKPKRIYSCGKCAKEFNPKYKLTLTQNY